MNISPSLAYPALSEAMPESFHAVSVDGDPSPNDSLMLLAHVASLWMDTKRKRCRTVLSNEPMRPTGFSTVSLHTTLSASRSSKSRTDHAAQRVKRNTARANNSPLRQCVPFVLLSPKRSYSPISKTWSSTVSTVPEHCLVVTGGIVLLKQVLSEVTIEVAPYGVDVVGVVLRVVELDHE